MGTFLVKVAGVASMLPPILLAPDPQPLAGFGRST